MNLDGLTVRVRSLTQCSSVRFFATKGLGYINADQMTIKNQTEKIASVARQRHGLVGDTHSPPHGSWCNFWQVHGSDSSVQTRVDTDDQPANDEELVGAGEFGCNHEHTSQRHQDVVE